MVTGDQGFLDALHHDLELRQQADINQAASIITGWAQSVRPPERQGEIYAVLVDFIKPGVRGAQKIKEEQAVNAFTAAPVQWLVMLRDEGLTGQESLVKQLTELRGCFNRLSAGRSATNISPKTPYEEALGIIDVALAVLPKQS